MMEIVKNVSGMLSSASKLVLLMLTAAACIGLFTGHIDQQVFNNALMMVLGAYFGKTQITGTAASK